MPVGTRSFRTQFTASCLILMLCSAHCIQVSNKAEHHAGTLARLSEYGLARSRAEHAFSSFVSKKETKTQLVEHRQLDSIGGECRYHFKGTTERYGAFWAKKREVTKLACEGPSCATKNSRCLQKTMDPQGNLISSTETDATCLFLTRLWWTKEIHRWKKLDDVMKPYDPPSFDGFCDKIGHDSWQSYDDLPTDPEFYCASCHSSDGQKIKQVEEHPCCRKGEHSYILPMNLLQEEFNQSGFRVQDIAGSRQAMMRELLFLYLRATDDFLETPQKAVSLERVGGAFSLVALHYKPEVEGDILDCTVNDVKAGYREDPETKEKKRCRPDMTSKQEVDMLMDLVKSIKERPCGRESFSQSLKDGTLLLRDIAECRMTDEDAQKVRELDQNAGTGRTACDIYLSAEKRMYIESAPDDETRNARTKEHKKELVDWGLCQKSEAYQDEVRRTLKPGSTVRKKMLGMLERLKPNKEKAQMDKEGGIEKAVASEAKQVDALTEDAGAFLDLDGALPVPLSLSKLKRSSERGSSPSTWDVKMGHGRGGLHPSATLASSPELIEIGDLTLADLADATSRLYMLPQKFHNLKARDLARLPSFHTFSKDKLDLTDDRGQSIFGPPVLDKSLDGEGKQNNASSKTSFTQAEEVEGSSDPSLRFSLLESLDQIGFGDPLGPSSSSSNSSASSSLAREGAATGMVQLVKRDWESKEIDAQTMELREVLKHIGHLLLGIVMIAAGILCFALMILWPWSFLIAILIGLIFCAAGGHELSNGWAGCIIMSLGNPWLPLMAGGVLVAAEAF